MGEEGKLKNGSQYVGNKKKKEKWKNRRGATYFRLRLVPTTTSAPVGEVVDVALALAPLPRMESHKDEPLRAA